MTTSKTIVCGAGVSGLVSSLVLARHTNTEVHLVGMVSSPIPTPMGPWYPWVTPSMGHLLGMVGLNPRIRSVEVGYWDDEVGPEVTRTAPNEGFLEWYASVTHNRQGTRLTEGRTTFIAYDLEWGTLVDRLQGCILEAGVNVVDDRITTLERSGSWIGVVNDITIDPEDSVVFCFPLPQIEALLYGKPITLYWPVGFATVDAVPFDWPPGVDYVYTKGADWPWHRVTKVGTSYQVETGSYQAFNQCSRILLSMTPGSHVPLAMINAYQVGRMARGDRSKLSDAVQQALTVARLVVKGDGR